MTQARFEDLPLKTRLKMKTFIEDNIHLIIRGTLITQPLVNVPEGKIGVKNVINITEQEILGYVCKDCGANLSSDSELIEHVFRDHFREFLPSNNS